VGDGVDGQVQLARPVDGRGLVGGREPLVALGVALDGRPVDVVEAVDVDAAEADDPRAGSSVAHVRPSVARDKKVPVGRLIGTRP